MSETYLKIEIHPDKKLAPRYPARTVKLTVTKAVITEKGTKADLPIVDFQCKDENGMEYYICMTGRIVTGISAVIQGINLRNHGVVDP
jgi:hypothetical protein